MMERMRGRGGVYGGGVFLIYNDRESRIATKTASPGYTLRQSLSVALAFSVSGDDGEKK
jgi:hypothetical protein